MSVPLRTAVTAGFVATLFLVQVAVEGVDAPDDGLGTPRGWARFEGSGYSAAVRPSWQFVSASDEATRGTLLREVGDKLVRDPNWVWASTAGTRVGIDDPAQIQELDTFLLIGGLGFPGSPGLGPPSAPSFFALHSALLRDADDIVITSRDVYDGVGWIRVGTRVDCPEPGEDWPADLGEYAAEAEQPGDSFTTPPDIDALATVDVGGRPTTAIRTTRVDDEGGVEIRLWAFPYAADGCVTGVGAWEVPPLAFMHFLDSLEFTPEGAAP